jgi:hypothetical protein
MTILDLLEGISQHLESMALALNGIHNLRPPADPRQMRGHHSHYIANFMSAVDMIGDVHGKRFWAELEAALATPNVPGAVMLGYMRELRNSVVHRGLDPATGGIVVDGVVCAVAPAQVESRKGDKRYNAPAPLLRDLFVHCDICSKPIIERFLEPGFEEVASMTQETALKLARDFMKKNGSHMPDPVKAMSLQFLENIDLKKGQADQMEKLRAMLKPCPGQRIA